FCKKQTHIPLTDNKKWMVINIHRYLFSDISITKQKQNFTLNKQVALVSGISESIVGVVLPDWNKQNNGMFLSNQKIGQPKLGLNKDIEWLNTHQISFPNNLHQPELLELVQ
ncbi:17769_t:CDS:1, partial [Gigaspora margarita]